MAYPLPHGGRLLTIKETSPSDTRLREIASAPKIMVDDETRTTVHNIASGILSPLDGFMAEADYHGVIGSMRLNDDTPWTIPILLHVPADFKGASGDEVTLVDEAGAPIAILEFSESYKISKKEFANRVYGTEDAAHPGVAKLYESSEVVVAGKLTQVVARPDDQFADFTLSPRETRFLFRQRGWKEIVAFQTRNAPHIGHEYVQKTALTFADGIFINPVIGKKKSGDFKDDVILDTNRALVKNYYPANSVVLSVLRYEMQYAGPKEAIMHAIMRKNFGCTHIAIGRDHAGVGNYYGPYAAQEIFKEFPDLGIEPVFFKEFFYCNRCGGIASEKICPHPESDRLTFSGTKLRKMFQAGETPPKEFMRPEVSRVILDYPSPFVE